MSSVPTPSSDLRAVARSEKQNTTAGRADTPVRQAPPAVEPRIRPTPRPVEPEPDYYSPSPAERAHLLRAAFDASAHDPEQHLLIAELMAHYRAWCEKAGHGDPFEGEYRAPRAD